MGATAMTEAVAAIGAVHASSVKRGGERGHDGLAWTASWAKAQGRGGSSLSIFPLYFLFLFLFFFLFSFANF